MSKLCAALGVGLVVLMPAGLTQGDRALAENEAVRAPARLVTLQGARRSVPGRIGRAWEVGQVNGNIVVLDAKNHQLAVKKSTGDWSFASGIGNRAGELYYPTEMVIEPSTGRIAVYEGGNRRLQVFDAELQSTRTFGVVDKAYGLAWWGEDLIVGCPTTGSLLSKIDATGAFSGSIGALIEPAQIARFEHVAQSNRRLAVNRVRVATTNTNELWVAFVHLPLVRRYGPSGELSLERSLNLRGLGSLPRFAQAVWNASDRPAEASYINIDGVQLPLVSKDIAVDPQSGTPLLLLGNDWIATLDHDGRIRKVREVEGCGPSFHRLTVDSERRVVLLASLEKSFLCEVQLGDLLSDDRPATGSRKPVEH